jgi:hypothetical protein
VNWIYVLGTIGIIFSVIGGINNKAKERTQNNIAAGIMQAQRTQQRQQNAARPSPSAQQQMDDLKAQIEELRRRQREKGDQ